MRTTVRSYRSLCVLGLLAVVGCASETADDTGGDEQAQVAGADGRVLVDPTGSNVAARLRPALGAYGRLEIDGESTEACSVAYIGRRLALTAGSCILRPPTQSARTTPGTFYAVQPLAPTVRKGAVSFDHGSPTGPLSFTVLELEVSAERDYAILKLPYDLDRPALALDLARPASGVRVSVFGYGAPPASYLGPVAGEASTFLTVGSGKASELAGTRLLQHDCDTVVGMTGAALVNDSTGKLIALHGGRAGAANWGTPVSEIPTLRSYVLGSVAPPNVHYDIAVTAASINMRLWLAALDPAPKTVDLKIYKDNVVVHTIPSVAYTPGMTVTIDRAAFPLEKGYYIVRSTSTDEFGLTANDSASFTLR